MNDKLKISASVSGRYKFQVVENGRVVNERTWSENMILDQGLDFCCSGNAYIFPSLFRYHAIGTGTASVSASDVGLGNETKRTGTLLVGAGNTGTTVVGNVITYRYTFDHTIEDSNKNYTEHGLSYTSIPGNNLFSRALISGGTLTVLAGQQARCVYDVTVTITPGVATNITVGGTGWPVSGVTDCTGQYILGELFRNIGIIDTNGLPTVGGAALLIGGTGSSISAVALTSIAALPSFGNAIGTTTIGESMAYTRDAYTAGTFTFTIRPVNYASATAWNSTNIQGWSFNYGGIYFKYTYPQTKASTHRLRYPSLTVTWARA